MAIKHIQFRSPVAEPIGNGYSAAKHARDFELVEKGQWIFILPRGGGSVKGQRYRIPVSNVVSITEDDVVEVVK